MYRIYFYKFLSEFWVLVPVIVPLYHSHGMSATQILVVQATYSLSQMLFEIPSGYVSDVIGRKRTLVAGAFMMFCGVCVYAFADSFYWFIVAEAILGVSGALRSGTDSALLYDSLKAASDEKQYKSCEGRAEFFSRMGTALSAVSGGFLGAYVKLRLPFYVNIGSAALMVILGLSLSEPVRQERPNGDPLKGIIRIALRAVAHPELFGVMASMAAFTCTGITAIWGYFMLYKSYELPLWSHGIIFAAMQTISAFGARHAADIERFIGVRWMNRLLWGFGVVFVLVALSRSPIMLLPLVFIHAAIWGASTPLFLERVQHLTSSDVRATTLSVGAMVGRVVLIGWGPLFGTAVDRFSIDTAFALMGGAAFIIPILLLVAGKVCMKGVRRWGFYTD